MPTHPADTSANFAPWAALFVSLAVLAVLAVAGMQYVIAHHKLRLDLYDRRFKIYKICRDYLLHVRLGGAWDDKKWEEEATNFAAATAEAEFLFGKSVVEYIRHIKSNAAEASVALREGQRLQKDAPERKIQADKWVCHLKWMEKQLISELSETFRPFIGFSQIRGDTIFKALDDI